MAATTHDLHDDSDAVQPAMPGSYGLPPAGERLPEATRLGAVRLQIADLARSIDYYRDVVGLRVVSTDRFVRHLSEIGARAGAGDHLVSEAFYLTDPDGPGIEVYADRPRDTWARVGRELQMATDPCYPGALFLAAGGYHHHLGPNTWAGPTAAPPRSDDAQLLAWTLELPDADSLKALVARLDAAGHPVTAAERGIVVRDPWGTRTEVGVTLGR